MLRDLDLLTVYSRNNCPDLVKDFFVPLLSHAVRYDRSTFTFSPAALAFAASGLAELINNDGSMRLICHHELPRNVVQAVVDGHLAAEDAVLESLANHPLVRVEANDLKTRSHLELLTWLVKEGRLEIRVAIPRGEIGIFHRKSGIFSDSNGDVVAFDGSINESTLGWQYNDEQITVFNSWEDYKYLKPLADEFELLWHNKAETSMVIPIPEALRQNLIEFAPAKNPAKKRNEPINGQKGSPQALSDSFRQLRDEFWEAIGHTIRNDPYTTIETIAAELWPHQYSFWRHYGRDVEAPPRVLVADEVGLGKTIQAGAVLKTIINRGHGERILILTPAVARWQWQAELRQKFNIDIPVLDRRGAQLQFAGSDGDRQIASGTPWREVERLILSYDWLRRNAEQFFGDEPQYDMVVFDEAHHARYLDVSNPRRRRDNSYLRMLRKLSQCSSGLMLLTATPMQIDPSELWALLETLDPNGQWNEAEFRRFYDVNTSPTLEWWNTARQVYSRDGIPGTVEQIAELARLPLSEAREHLEYIQMPASNAVVLRRDMTPERLRGSMSLMRRSSSIKRRVSRHTRNLLRQYAQEGRLSQSVPQRDVRSVAVRMNETEQGLYEDIRKMVRECYQGRSNINRQALGFVMTHFRLRLGSSLYAFRQSLEDLQERGKNANPEEIEWNEIPVEEEDNYSDIDPETGVPAPELTTDGQQMLSEMIEKCYSQTNTDSKYVSLLEQIDSLRSHGYAKVMVFSQFRDTQVWLREQLAKEVGNNLLAGLSGSEDWGISTF